MNSKFHFVSWTSSARWLVESEVVPIRLLQERFEEEFLGEAELIKIKAQDLKGKAVRGWKEREKLFGRPIECCHVDAQNKQVLEQHLVCAAHEHPLSVLYDEQYFGSCLESALISLKARGYLSYEQSSESVVQKGELKALDAHKRLVQKDVDLEGLSTSVSLPSMLYKAV
ncbi:hypothetical protein K1719_001968 [Acacia pycnantha]|nr:hypothetical protein K1719_001968 [Acacia pycnantha]